MVSGCGREVLKASQKASFRGSRTGNRDVRLNAFYGANAPCTARLESMSETRNDISHSRCCARTVHSHQNAPPSNKEFTKTKKEEKGWIGPSFGVHSPSIHCWPADHQLKVGGRYSVLSRAHRIVHRFTCTWLRTSVRYKASPSQFKRRAKRGHLDISHHFDSTTIRQTSGFEPSVAAGLNTRYDSGFSHHTSPNGSSSQVS